MLMQIIDTHCHYNLDPLFSDWQTHWQKAQAEGVIASVVIGTDVLSSRRAITIAESDLRLPATVAMHPGEFNEDTIKLGESYVDEQCQLIRELASHNRVIAIGETGLDYFHLQHLSPQTQEQVKVLQKLSLRRHLELAQEKKLPIILHVRDTGETAYWDTLNLVKESQFSGTFILHCVSGPLKYIEAAIQMGAYISAAGNMTYASAHHLREIARLTPADRLLLETDAPFLPPVPHRGKLCQPWMMRLTAEYLQKELAVDLQQCVKNSLTLFPKLSTVIELQ